LEHLHHNGLVHRDIKPANIVYVGGVAKLADIGLITHASDTCSIVGTEGYIAPEGPGTPGADLYSLGKVLYEAATGKDRRDYPAVPDGVREWQDAKLMKELNAVILRACAREPRARYSNAGEIRGDLERLMRGGSVRRRQRAARSWKLARKGAAWLAVLACIGSLVLLTLRLRNPEARLEASKRSTNEGAQTEYEIGRNFYRKADNMEEAARHLRNALKEDPNFALAEGALAATYAWG